MTRQNPMCDRDMTSSPDDTVVRSSTEDQVVESSRDVSVADHNTPDPVIGRESPVMQDVMNAESSIQISNLHNSTGEPPVRKQPTRARPMSSRIYNPLPFKKRFLLTPDIEDETQPSEMISPPRSESMVSINTELVKRVSPKSPRLFSPVPYSRHCNYYSPVNWQNPSENNSSTELVTEDEQAHDGHSPVAPTCVEEKAEEPIYLEEVKLNDEQDTKADECFEVNRSTDNPVTTEDKCLGEVMVNDVQKSSEESVNCEVDDVKNGTESSSSDEWLIDQHSPTIVRSLIDEWTKKRSEDYQKTLKRPLTVILEEDVECPRDMPSPNSGVIFFNDVLKNIDELAIESKSPLRDSLEEFVKLERNFIEEENKRQTDQVNIESSEKSECTALHVNRDIGDDISFNDSAEQIPHHFIDCEQVNKSSIRDSLEEFVKLEKHFIEEEIWRKDQLINMKPDKKSGCYELTKSATEIKQSCQTITEVMKHINEEQPAGDTEIEKADVLDKNNETTDIKETGELKKMFANCLKEKEYFDIMIEKREIDLKRQLREMDQSMETVHNGHADLEKATGDFAGAMKIYNNYKNEIVRDKEQCLDQEVSIGMLQSENSDLENELRDVYDNIEDIHRRRSAGLEGLEENIGDMKREEILLKEGNNKIESDTKKKMTEFNELRMTVMEKGITYVKKGTIVKGAGSANLPNVVPIMSTKYRLSDLSIDLTKVENKPPDINTPRKNTFEKNHHTGELRAPKGDSEQNIDDNDSFEKQIGHPDGLVRLPNVREGRSKLPKPTYKIYGIDERNQISDIESSNKISCKTCNIDKYMTQNQERQVIKPVSDSRKKKKEVSRLNDVHNQTDGVDMAENFSVDGKAYKYDVKRYKSSLNKSKTKSDIKGVPLSDDKHNVQSLQKPAIVSKRKNKKEIKSKIDTGLKNRPVNKESISSNKNDTKKTNALPKISAMKNTRNEVPSVNGKTQSLPPLKKAQNEYDVPRSPTFDNKAPLPGIQPAKQQRINKINVSEKRVVTPRVLPPIKAPPNAGRLPALEIDNKTPEVPSKNQTRPQAIWISTRRRSPVTDRSTDDDDKRVLHERA